MKDKAFTLIEMLVVVLIIGILAAIALPQYRKVIAKSRMTEALTNVRTLAAALERYYLINTSYTTNFENLDITMGEMIPTTNSYENSVIFHRSGNYLYWLSSYGSAGISYPAQGKLEFFIEYINPHSTNNHRNHLICSAYGTTETIYDEICKSLGGVYIGAGNANGLPKRWYKI
jgi:prepilin-type N-terminal cleavage/methylation domain-containing protein